MALGVLLCVVVGVVMVSTAPQTVAAEGIHPDATGYAWLVLSVILYACFEVRLLRRTLRLASTVCAPLECLDRVTRESRLMGVLRCTKSASWSLTGRCALLGTGAHPNATAATTTTMAIAMMTQMTMTTTTTSARRSSARLLQLHIDRT